MATVSVQEFADRIGLELVCGEKENLIDLRSADINRAGLQLAGFLIILPMSVYR